MKKLIAVIFIAVLVTGCAGTPINMSHARMVKVGMTEAEITGLMGKPYSITTKGDDQIWVWANANGITGAHTALSYGMHDGKVTSVPTIPSSFQ
jgi:hypothetical protein